MARPKSKSELLNQAQGNFEKLIQFVESFDSTEQEKDFPEGTLNRNIRDVLAHLHAWHLMLLDWYTVGMSGQKPDMPAKGHSWKTLPNLNKEILERYSKITLTNSKSLFR